MKVYFYKLFSKIKKDPYLCNMNRKINFNLCLKIALAIMIAYQSYKVFTIEKKMDEMEQNGQMKCSKPQ